MATQAPADATDARADRWFGPGVAGIGGASFLADLGHEIPTALLPSLLTSTLRAPASALGLIEGISDAAAGIARFGGGALADDPGRRRAIAVGGYTTTAVLSAGLGAVAAPWQAGILRASAWGARGLRVPARNALLADIVPPNVYGRAYGFERTMDNLGAVGGPLLAIGLLAAVGIRWAIGLSVIPGILAAFAIVYAIRHTTAPTRRERKPIRLRVRSVMHGGLGKLMVGITVFELGNCAATLLILRATDLFRHSHSQLSATQLALILYVLYNLAATIISIPAGRYLDRTNPVRVMAAGAALFAAGYVWFAIGTSNTAALAPAFILVGLGIGCAETAQAAAVATVAPTDLRGSAFGLLATTQAAANLAASATAGILWTTISPTAAFTFLAAAAAVALPLIITSRTSTR
jgi:MFS family permease